MAFALRLSGRFEQGAKYIVAICDELPITASGTTREEAVGLIDDAARAYLSALSTADPESFAEIITLLTDPNENHPVVIRDGPRFETALTGPSAAALAQAV